MLWGCLADGGRSAGISASGRSHGPRLASLVLALGRHGRGGRPPLLRGLRGGAGGYPVPRTAGIWLCWPCVAQMGGNNAIMEEEMRDSDPTHNAEAAPSTLTRAVRGPPLSCSQVAAARTPAPPASLSPRSSPARVAQLDRIARGKQAGARAPGHLGGSASGGAAAHLWPALRARARQRRRAGRPGASLRPSGDVGRQGADDNELRASSKAHMLLYAGGAAAACPHQPRLGRDRGTRPGFPSVLEPALLAMGGDDPAPGDG
jgi:hypothetical protein